MAYTQVAPQAVTDAGHKAVYTAPSGAGAGNGDSIPGDGRTMLHVKNGGASALTVTVITGRTVDGKAIEDDPVVIAAGEDWHIGFFDPAVYNKPPSDAANPGRVVVEYSTVTSVTRAVLGF